MSAQAHPAHSDDLHNADVAHEHDDINVRAIIWFVAVLTGIALAINVSMWGMFRVLDHFERKGEPYVSPLTPAPAAGPEAWPEPRLQTRPWEDLGRFRADQQNRLQTYGWVDEKLGVARIPIAKAKEMLLQRGLPVRPELADEMEGTHVAATGESSGGRNLPGGSADKSAPAGGGAAAPSAAPVTTAPAAPGKPGGGL